MLGNLLVALLSGKASWLVAAKIPLVAVLLVVSTTGFIVTGTVSHGEDGDENVNLTITPLESAKCLEALVARTEALLTLDLLAGDTSAQLRQARERAREQAEDLHKDLDEATLLAAYNLYSGQIRDALAQARQDVLNAADLDKCQDGNKDTTVDLDVADLRARYDQIVRDFGTKLNQISADAQDAFDQIVASSPDKPKPPKEASGDSHSGD